MTREDAISRQAMFNILLKYKLDESRIAEELEQLPPVNPQPKTGHWIRWYEKKGDERCVTYIPHCKCSVCNKEYDSYSSQFIKYCSECGAKMVEIKEYENWKVR